MFLISLLMNIYLNTFLFVIFDLRILGILSCRYAAITYNLKENIAQIFPYRLLFFYVITYTFLVFLVCCSIVAMYPLFIVQNSSDLHFI